MKGTTTITVGTRVRTLASISVLEIRRYSYGYEPYKYRYRSDRYDWD